MTGMRKTSIPLLLFLFCLLLVSGFISLSAQAQTPTPAADTTAAAQVYLPLVRGGSLTSDVGDVVSVSANTQQADLLPEAEVALIETLQTTVAHSILSDVGPDERTVLVAGASTFFLDITSGSSVPLAATFAEYSCLSDIVWSAATTATCIASASTGTTVRLELNSSTGAVTATQELRLPGSVVSLAPDGSRLLLSASSSQQQLAGTTRLASPFDMVVNAGLPLTASRPDTAPPWGRVNVASITTTLSLYDLRDGSSTPLLTLPAGSFLNGTPIWSPESNRVAFSHTSYDRIDDDPSYDDPGDGTLLDSVAAQNVLGRLAPADNPLFQTNQLHLFDLSSSTVQSQTLEAAAGTGATFGNVPWHPARQMAWSPDGSLLAVQMRDPSDIPGREHPVYLYAERSFYRVYYAPPGLTQTVQLSATIQAPQVAAPVATQVLFPANDTLLFHSVYAMDYGIYRYDLRSQQMQQVSPRPGSYASVQVAEGSDTLVFTFSSYTSAPEIYRLGLDGSGLSALTSDNSAAQAANNIRADSITFTLTNNLTHTGYLLQPADAPFPPQNAHLIVWQEQGPVMQMVNYWSATPARAFNVLPNFGYALLIVPLYGREGFGPDNLNRLMANDNYGAVDVDAMAEIVRQLLDSGATTPNQVGILGCSYGSYFLHQSLIRHPDLYQAANSQCNLLDMVIEWKYGFVDFAAYLIGGDPYSDSEEFRQDSPIYHVAPIRTPLLIFHGANDFLPVTVAENYYYLLKQQGATSRMIRFEDEGHEVVLARNQLYAAQEQISWFRTYLGTP